MTQVKTRGRIEATTQNVETARPEVAHQEADATVDSLQLLLREAGRYRLLTPAEEIELAK
ncbi:MAG: hypothetical protein AVDCRST_MAG38-2980, partial [uncultured Solirubrobacteraceae bacterium]